MHSTIGVWYWLTNVRTTELSFPLPLVANETIYSDAMERVLGVCVATILGVLLITIFWNGIFWGWENARGACLIIGVASVFVGVVSTPYNFMYEMDNASLYVLAVRGIVDYWNGFYQIPIYNACLIVLYHPATIAILQSLAFLSVIEYLRRRIWKKYHSKLCWCILLVFLLPSTADVMINPYRNNINTILCLWIVGMMLLDFLDGTVRTKKEVVIITCILGWMAAYRTENLFIMFFYFALLILRYQLRWKKLTIIYGLLFLMLFAFFSIPQKMGDQKYYGKDYLIISQMNTLQYILRHPKVNLTYNNATYDIDTIHTFADIPAIYGSGLEGYRAKRMELCGMVNQSLKSEKEQKDFLKACYRLYAHNIKLFLEERLDTLGQSSAYEGRSKINDMSIAEIYNQIMVYFQYNYAEVGRDCQKNPLWSDTVFQVFTVKLANMVLGYAELLYKTHIWAILRTCCFFSFFGVALMAYKRLDKAKIVSLALMAMVGATIATVFLFEPEGRKGYLVPICFVMALITYLLSLEIIEWEKKHNNNKHNMKYIDEK